MSNKAFILLAAGSSHRMNGTTSDKILVPILGKPAFAYSLSVFIRSNAFQEGIIVYRDETQKQALEKICTRELQSLTQHGANTNIPIKWVQGGKRRQDSSFLGIHASSDHIDWVYLHDCARPCLTLETLQSFIQEADPHTAALLVSPMTDTVKQNLKEQQNTFNHNQPLTTFITPQTTSTQPDISWTKTLSIDNIMKDSRIPSVVQSSEQFIYTIPREDLFCAQTPQAFKKSLILEALQYAFENEITLTDDASALEAMQKPVHMVVHNTANPKLTYPHDLLIAEALLQSTANHSS